MDKLLGSFTKKYINIIEVEYLQHLCDLLDFDDENLYKFNQGQKTSIKIEHNKISELFKKFKFKNE